jgi:hypothetical protein
MKSNLLPIILGLFIVPSLAQTSVSTNQPTLDNQAQISQTSSPEKQDSPILSGDYKIAKQSLDKAISERDEATIRLGINASSAQLRRDVYQAIANLYYQWFVPDLIKALEENQNFDNDGIKTRSEQKKANKSIISALQHLTGLGFFPNEKILPAEEFLEIRNKTLEWYETHEKQIEEAMQKERLMMKQEISILSKYYYPAQRAFEKAVLEKDKITLRLGLKAFSLTLRSKVVIEIKQLDDKSFVPDLIVALEANQAIMSGGSETQSMQNQLNKEIVFALEKLTELQFTYFDDSPSGDSFFEYPRKDIERILKESRDWCRTHQLEC